MGNYNSENGAIQLPAKEFSGFKKRLIELVKTRNLHLYEKALWTYHKVKAEKQGKRGFDIGSHIYKLLNPETRSWAISGGEYSHDEIHTMQDAIMDNGKLIKPKKSKFVTGKDHFNEGELTVTLDSKTRTVVWDVMENNRSVEAAHGGFLGRNVMRMLKNVTYTNRTGGIIEYFDEYMRDEGSGSEVSHRFGRFANPKLIMKEMKLRSKLDSLRY